MRVVTRASQWTGGQNFGEFWRPCKTVDFATGVPEAKRKKPKKQKGKGKRDREARSANEAVLDVVEKRKRAPAPDSEKAPFAAP